MTITKAAIVIGRKPAKRNLSPTMIGVLRKMRDGDKALYTTRELGVTYATMSALYDRRMVKANGGWFLTAYGIDTINYIDERKRIP